MSVKQRLEESYSFHPSSAEVLLVLPLLGHYFGCFGDIIAQGFGLVVVAGGTVQLVAQMVLSHLLKSKGVAAVTAGGSAFPVVSGQRLEFQARAGLRGRDHIEHRFCLPVFD